MRFTPRSSSVTTRRCAAKRVTVFLADGRTTVLGIPILVEKPKAAVPVTGNRPATPKR